MAQTVTVQGNGGATGWAVVTGVVVTQEYIRTGNEARVMHVFIKDDAWEDATQMALYIEGASVIPYVEDK